MIANAACICRFSSEDTVGLSIGASANSVAVTVAEQGVSVYTTEQQVPSKSPDTCSGLPRDLFLCLTCVSNVPFPVCACHLRW